jgi:hypothetical protein
MHSIARLSRCFAIVAIAAVAAVMPGRRHDAEGYGRRVTGWGLLVPAAFRYQDSMPWMVTTQK